MRDTRASRLHSHITTTGTYRIASRRSQRLKNAAARGPSLPPPAAWNTSACVSETAASGSATAARPLRRSIAGRRFFHHHGATKRRVEQCPDRRIRMVERRIAVVYLNGADDRPRGTGVSGRPCGADDLIEELADAPEACRTGASLEPRQVLRVEGDGDGLLTHTIIIR